MKEKPFMTVQELRRAVGEDFLSLNMAYAFARVYGFRLGKRLVVPASVVDEFMQGRVDLERVRLEARKRSGRL